MRWIKLSAALMILAATSQANAGLFDCFKHDHGCCEPSCCAPEPTCCHVEPSCCAPAPSCCHVEATCCTPAPMACHVAPSCCAPAPTCCHVEPSCCAPEPTCCDSCGPVYNCCPPKKSCFGRLWDCETRKNRWIMGQMGW